MSGTKKYTRLLLRAVRELAYIQDVENCHSGLCKTAEGKSIVDDGMAALGLRDLSDESTGGCCARLQQPPARMSAREWLQLTPAPRFMHEQKIWFDWVTTASLLEAYAAHCAAAQPALKCNCGSDHCKKCGTHADVNETSELCWSCEHSAHPSGEQAGVADKCPNCGSTSKVVEGKPEIYECGSCYHAWTKAERQAQVGELRKALECCQVEIGKILRACERRKFNGGYDHRDVEDIARQTKIVIDAALATSPAPAPPNRLAQVCQELIDDSKGGTVPTVPIKFSSPSLTEEQLWDALADAWDNAGVSLKSPQLCDLYPELYEAIERLLAGTEKP